MIKGKNKNWNLIKSRLNIFTIFLIFFGTLIFMTVNLSIFIHIYTESGVLWVSDLFVPTFMSVFCLISSLNILLKMKSITIDKHLKTITLKNYLTGYKRQYTIKELDGYSESSWGKGFKSIIFFKNKTRIEKVSNIYILNFNEILKGLEKINNLGIDSTSIIERTKDFFRIK